MVAKCSLLLWSSVHLVCKWIIIIPLSQPSAKFCQILLISPGFCNPKCALHFTSQSLAITTFSSHEIAESWRCIHLSFILGGEIGFGCELKYGLTQFIEVLNSFSKGQSPSYFLQMGNSGNVCVPIFYVLLSNAAHVGKG